MGGGLPDLSTPVEGHVVCAHSCAATGEDKGLDSGADAVACKKPGSQLTGEIGGRVRINFGPREAARPTGAERWGSKSFRYPSFLNYGP